MLDQFKVLDPLELQLEELQADTSANAAAAEEKAAGAVIKSLARRRPVRAPLPAHLLPAHLLPAHLPRERVVVPARCACLACGGRLAKLGEDIAETLEIIPRQGKVVQTVREKFTCRSCEKITQPPAADRIHGDDATVPVLAKNKAVTGRLWTPAFARAGSMSEMTGPLAAAIRRPPCFSIRATAAASIRAGISAICGLGRYPAGRRRRLSSGRPTAGPGGRVWRIVRGAAKSAAHYRSRVPGPRPAQVLCAGRSEAGATQGPLRGHSGATQGALAN